MSKSEDIQSRIVQLRKEIDGVCSFHVNSGSEISKKQSEIFVLSAQLADLASQRLERQTETLIRLTWGIFLLTVALLLFTAYLSFDIYQHRQAEKAEHKATTEQH
jgi:hypothetical protein